jgi:xylan 1,4-beta-xylosidase
VDPSFRVGGPATARDGWIAELIHFCETVGVALDFVSTHHYPTDALYPADPLRRLSTEAANTETQLARSRRSILRQWAQDTRRRAGDRPLYYTEWNTSSNPRDPLHDEPYAAAFVAKTLLEVSGLVEGYSFWTFSDIFEENYFPSVPFHGGFGLMTLHGIPKPTYRAFELVHRLGNERLLVDGLHHTVDGWVVRDKLEGRAVTILLTNHALPGYAIDTERVRVALVGATQPRRAFAERIDRDHANPKREWRAAGSPKFLDSAQVEDLQAASRISREPVQCEYAGGTVRFEMTLPPHAVAAVTLGF